MKADEEKRFREMHAGYESGLYTREEIFTQLVYGFDPENFAELILALPDALQTSFRQWAIRHFDNDLPADQFLMLTGDRPLSDAALQAIRRWL